MVFSNLIEQLPALREGASRVLVLAHRTELVQQAAATIARVCPTLRVGVEQGKQVTTIRQLQHCSHAQLKPPTLNASCVA